MTAIASGAQLVLPVSDRWSGRLCAVIPHPSPDPGWGRARDIVLMLVAAPFPFATRRREQNPLLGLRMLFIAFSVSLVGVGLVVLFLTAGPDPDRSPDPVATTLGVAVLGAILVTFSWRAGPKLACGSAAEALAASYRNRLFLRLALANASALIGFVGVSLTGSAMPYAAGLAWAVAGFVRVAPTAGNLERCQTELGLRGCPHRLVDVLQGSVPAR